MPLSPEASHQTLVTENGAPCAPGSGFGELIETSREVINGALVLTYHSSEPLADPSPAVALSTEPVFVQQPPMQQQMHLQQQIQQQQMHRAEPVPPEPTPEEIAREQRRKHAAALAWVEKYEPDRLW